MRSSDGSDGTLSEKPLDLCYGQKGTSSDALTEEPRPGI